VVQTLESALMVVVFACFIAGCLCRDHQGSDWDHHEWITAALWHGGQVYLRDKQMKLVLKQNNTLITWELRQWS